MEEEKKRTVSFELSENFYYALQDIAISERRCLSDVASLIIEKYLLQQKREWKLIKELYIEYYRPNSNTKYKVWLITTDKLFRIFIGNYECFPSDKVLHCIGFNDDGIFKGNYYEAKKLVETVIRAIFISLNE